MPTPEILTRELVCAAVNDWGTGSLTDEQMHLWATNNYFPAHQVVAPTEPDHVALAIGVVLTEFECAMPPYKFGKAVAATSIALIESSAKDFEARKLVFFESVRENEHAL